jgi:hypothetical protein
MGKKREARWVRRQLKVQVTTTARYCIFSDTQEHFPKEFCKCFLILWDYHLLILPTGSIRGCRS